jgi:hypothetical protein
MNNLAHLALSDLIIDFFYTTSLSMGKLFPEIFGEKVPSQYVDKSGLQASFIYVCTVFIHNEPYILISPLGAVWTVKG